MEKATTVTRMENEGIQKWVHSLEYLLGSVPSIHIEWLTPPITPSFGFPPKCIHRAHDTYTEREIATHTLKTNKQNFIKKKNKS